MGEKKQEMGPTALIIIHRSSTKNSDWNGWGMENERRRRSSGCKTSTWAIELWLPGF